jgi:hypothetical protein
VLKSDTASVPFVDIRFVGKIGSDDCDGVGSSGVGIGVCDSEGTGIIGIGNVGVGGMSCVGSAGSGGIKSCDPVSDI